MIDAPIIKMDFETRFPGEVCLRLFAERLREFLWEHRGEWPRSLYKIRKALSVALGDIIVISRYPLPGEGIERRHRLLNELISFLWVLHRLRWNLADTPPGQLASQLLEEIPHLAEESGARLELAIAQYRVLEAKIGRPVYIAPWAREFVRRLLKPRRRR